MGRIALAGLAVTALSCAAPAAAQWEKSVVKDKLTDKPTMVVLSVRSSESLGLPAPHEGENRATLRMRMGPAVRGMDVTLSVDKGQFMCSGPKDCRVRVRIGDGEPFVMRGSKPFDQSSNTLIFSEDAGLFGNQARTAEKVMVEATFFQAGTRVMNFVAPGGTDAGFKAASAASAASQP